MYQSTNHSLNWWKGIFEALLECFWWWKEAFLSHPGKSGSLVELWRLLEKFSQHQADTDLPPASCHLRVFQIFEDC